MKTFRVVARTMLLLGLLLLVAGCPEGDSLLVEADGDYHDGRVRATVHGTVMANDTQTPIQGVQVIYSLNNETIETTTDANGYYESALLTEGQYVFTFNSPDADYASWQEMVNVVYGQAQQVPSQEDFIQNIGRNVFLFRTDAGVKGYVYAQMNDEETVVAEGAVVRVMNLAGIVNQDYSDTTDADGFFMIDELPAVAGAQLLVLPWENDDVEFAPTTRNIQLTQGATVTVNPVVVLPNAGGVMVLSNNFANGDVAADQSFDLVFNRPILEDELNVVLTRINSGTTISTTVTVDPTMLQVTVQPVVPLQLSQFYRLDVDGTTVDFQDFDFSWNFTTEDGIMLESHNLEIADGIPREFELTEAAEFTFNIPVDPNNLGNVVEVQRGGTDVLVTWNLTNDNKTLEVEPVGSYLFDTAYMIEFTMFSEKVNDSYTTPGPLTIQTISNTIAPDPVTGLELDELSIPDGVDWNTTNIPLQWDAQENVSVYQVYATNSYSVTDNVLIAEFPPSVLNGTEYRFVNLANKPEFDWIDGDGIQTPFTDGIETDFMVRAVNGAGFGEFSNDLTVEDTRAPVLPGLLQNGSVNNPTDAEVTVIITFANNMEYCSESAPTVLFLDGGTPDDTLSPSDTEWTWNPNMRNGELVITVPPQFNGSGDTLIISNISDSSGNLSDGTTSRVLF